MRAFASKQDKLCPESQASLGLGYPSRKNVYCCILCLYFQSYLTVKNYQEWEYQAVGMPVLSQKVGVSVTPQKPLKESLQHSPG